MGNLAAEVEVEHAGFHPRDPFVGVDAQHAVHLRGDDHQRITERSRAAGEAGAAPPHHEGAVVLGGDAHGLGHVVAVAREAHRRRAAARDAGIARVEREFERLGARTVGAERGAQVGEERIGRVVTRDDGPETTTKRSVNTRRQYLTGRSGVASVRRG